VAFEQAIAVMSHAQFVERESATRGFWAPIWHLYYLTDHRVRQQTKGYALGFLWWFFDPLINTAILYVVFAVVLQVRTPNLVLFLLTGLLIYRFLQTSITSAGGSLIPAMALSSRLYVPKNIFVVRDVAAQFVQFLIGLVFIIAMIFVFGEAYIKPLQLAYVVLVAGTFALASASIVAFVSSVFRDLRVLLGYVFRALFFLSGIFFTLDQVPEEWRGVFLANPFALLIHELRIALLDPGPLDYGMLTILLGASLLLGVLGFFLLWKFDRILPKYVR
jgi:lipopolysaccharide transport system permease protein